jgi:pyruvate dehydrogenase E1 component
VIGITDAGSALIDSVRRDNASRLPECITRLHPADLAFLATINRVPTTALGVTRFGQSGSLENVYRHHGIDADSIIRAALDLTT